MRGGGWKTLFGFHLMTLGVICRSQSFMYEGLESVRSVGQRASCRTSRQRRGVVVPGESDPDPAGICSASLSVSQRPFRATGAALLL